MPDLLRPKMMEKPRVLKVMSNFFGKYMMLGSAVSLPTLCYRNKNWDLEQG